MNQPHVFTFCVAALTIPIITALAMNSDSILVEDRSSGKLLYFAGG